MWHIEKDLPYNHDFDENHWVPLAVEMVATEDWNPHWFGHPGATLLYPLAGLYAAWDQFVWHQSLPLDVRFEINKSDFYLLGRYLTVLYALLSLPLVFALGKYVWNVRVGMTAMFLMSVYPTSLAYAQTIRTDSASLFFLLLSLLAILNAYQYPSRTNHLLVGASIGLGIATHYFLVTLIPVSLFALLLKNSLRKTVLYSLMTLGTIILVFLATNPFFLVEIDTVIQDLFLESRVQNLGADGFSPVMNLLWYIGVGLPYNTAKLSLAICFIGMVLSWKRKEHKAMILTVFAVVYLVAISLHPLHWERWIIRLLPLVALFTAATLDTELASLVRVSPLIKKLNTGIFIIMMMLVSLLPAHEAYVHVLRSRLPSTRVEASLWMEENLPPGTKIAQEWFWTPSLLTSTLHSEFLEPLGQSGTLKSLQEQHFSYAVISQFHIDWFRDTERFPAESAFYRDLQEQGELIYEWKGYPDRQRNGPGILLYKLEK